MRRTVTLVALTGAALLAPLVAAGPGLAAPPVPLGATTLLVVDDSASMAHTLPDGESRASAVRASFAAVEQHVDLQRAGVLTFGSTLPRSTSSWGDSCNDVQVDARPIDPSVSVVDAAASPSSLLEGRTGTGRSPVAAALRTAANLVVPGTPAHIVLVTDGTDDCADVPVCERVGQIRADLPEARIDVVAIGTAAVDPTRREHACIATAGGGRSTTAGSTAQLTAALGEVLGASTGNALGATGFDGIALGDTLGRAASVAPELVASPTDVEPVVAETPSGWIRFDAGVATEFVPRDPIPTTAGLAVGDPRERALALYGEPIGSGTGAHGRYEYFETGPRSGAAYRVTVDGVRITRITLAIAGEPDRARAEGVADAAALPAIGAPTTLDGLDVTPTTRGIGPILIGMTEAELVAAVPDLGIWSEEDAGTWTSIPFDQWRVGSSEPNVCVIAGDLVNGGPHITILDGRVAAVATKAVSLDRMSEQPTRAEIGAAFGAVRLEQGVAYERWVVEGENGTQLQFFDAAGPGHRYDGRSVIFVGVYGEGITGRGVPAGEPCVQNDYR
ncbi:VWA domain-containing protein [Pseudoclavibacter chungangensis]|uniref:VWA domain-containing protein n=1 Tax=Pseudoclavibacter chungangensis TaxID=587635 RepID=A0A7J5C1V2_9MICO|nr:VWA domain-containing protein [Pseudoclavibacter chungangensis]KAB1662443.1 VWA domain-containing protein [Pseudoclavibacter chungangensis]NYJ68474.1 hypothetical protein [Pseudoclavibacter chungangensis]